MGSAAGYKDDGVKVPITNIDVGTVPSQELQELMVRSGLWTSLGSVQGLGSTGVATGAGKAVTVVARNKKTGRFKVLVSSKLIFFQ